MDEELIKCRLCNYQSDKRLMLNIFDTQSEYAFKIENYLNLKISSTSQAHSICFHCSQTIDNFHNFASKIKAIQNIIYPLEEVIQQIEIQPETVVIINSQDAIRKSPRKKSEKVFEELKRDVQIVQCHEMEVFEEASLQSHRSFDLNDVEGNFEESCDEEANLRDPDDEDFPSAAALRRIPTKLIENGSLLYKGKQLMSLLSIFYNTACKICTATRFKSISGLFQHYKDSHPATEPFVTCCSTKITKMPSIIWHFAKHIEPDKFKCKLCNYAVSRPKFLEIHLHNHLPEDEKPLQCDLCDKRFIWKGALKNHLMNHQVDRPEFVCNICNRKYQTAGSLSSHRKSTHVDTQKTRKLCEICSKSFSTLTAYKEHLTLHSDDRDKMQRKCPQCGKWLKNKRCYKSHLLMHTSDERKCELCDYTTKKEKLLQNHMTTKHSDAKTFKCDQEGCGKSFKVKRALTIHLAQHHDGKHSARKCEFCGREFASSTNYYTHRKNLHKKELQEAVERKVEEEKLKRIKAGLEDFNATGSDSVTIIEQTIFESRDQPIVITLSADAFGS